MKKFVGISLILCVILSLLLISVGCDKIIDDNVAVGSIISRPDSDVSGATSTPKKAPEETLSPAPFDYSGDYSGGGDEGGGITSFSSPESKDESRLISDSSLPIPSTHAVVLTGGVVDILENVKLKPDGTLDTTNKNYLNDAKFCANLLRMKQELSDKKFNDVRFLTVVQKTNSDEGEVRIKLDSSYRRKTAHVFFVNENGSIVKLSSNKDYISYKLDEHNFADDILTLKFGPQPGTFVLAFGA